MEVADGFYNGQIINCEIIKSRYAKEGENRLEVEIECGVFDANNHPLPEHVKAYLELSGDYPKFGDTTKPYWQVSLNQLHELGLQGDDLTTLGTLKGRPCRLAYRSKDKNGQPLKTPGWHLSREKERVVVSIDDANAALRQMMGGFSAAPIPASMSAAINPFA